MSQHRKHRGYDSQRIVANYLASRGWPHALSAGAGRAGSDVTGVPFDVEVKARRGFPAAAAMRQLAERATDRLGFAVLRLDGQGPQSIADWPCVIRLADLTDLLTRLENTDDRALPVMQ